MNMRASCQNKTYSGIENIPEKEVEGLSRSEKRFLALIENSVDAIYMADKDGQVLYISPAFERMFGYTFEEVSIKSRQDLIHPDGLEKSSRIFEKILQELG